jgi:ankyrin repeat protein
MQWSALIWAAFHNNVELLGQLLLKGADTNGANKVGLSP